LPPLQFLRVEFHPIAIVPGRARNILQHIPRLAQGFRKLAELRIVAGSLVQGRRGAAQQIDGALVAPERLMRAIRRRRKRFSVLGSGKLGRKLLVFALARVHSIDALQHEARLIELRRRGGSGIADPGKLRRRPRRLGERLPIRAKRLGHVLPGPCVEHPHVRRRLQKLLLIVLAAQIDGRRHRARQLPHACHAAVKRDARAPIGAHAAHGHQLIFVFTRLTAIRGRAGKPEETPADLQAILAIPHGILVRAGAHEQLERRQQRRFADARLAREHGQALRGDKGGLLYQRQVLNLHLVDHGGSFCVRIMRPQHVRLFYIAQYTSLAAQQARTRRLFGVSDISRQETSPYPRKPCTPAPSKGRTCSSSLQTRPARRSRQLARRCDAVAP